MGDSRYAVIVGERDNPDADYFALELGVEWYLDYGIAPSVSTSLSKLRAIMLEPGVHPIPVDIIETMAAESPGSYYQLGNEPNVVNNGFSTPSGYADVLHYYATHIKSADPEAKIVGPNILNFDFTCLGCRGYKSGRSWLDEMRSIYLTRYGDQPPIDIWGIHFYPLDWTHLPTTNEIIVILDLQAFMRYLIEIGSANPVWITEFGLHWGFSEMTWTAQDGRPCAGSDCMSTPAGTYETEEVIRFLDIVTSVFEYWNTISGLERWFLYRNYFGFGPNETGTSGLTVFDSHLYGAQLTEIGQFYKDKVFGVH